MRCKKAKQCNVCDGWFKMGRGCLLEKRCVSCRELGLQKNIEIRSSNPGKFIHEATLHSLITPRGGSLILSTPTTEVLESYMEYEQHLHSYDIIDNEELNSMITDVFKALKEREIMVINMRTGLNGEGELTYKEIGDVLGVSTERARQIENSAMKKLKHPRVSRQLKNYIRGEF